MVPTPVWSVNAPTACIRCNATGKRSLSCFLSRILINILFHFNRVTKMKNQIALPVSQARESRITLWLESENSIITSIMEESVSNRQTLLLSNAMLAFSVMACSVFLHWAAALICLIWFILSLIMCRKGGLR